MWRGMQLCRVMVRKIIVRPIILVPKPDLRQEHSRGRGKRSSSPVLQSSRAKRGDLCCKCLDGQKVKTRLLRRFASRNDRTGGNAKKLIPPLQGQKNF